jgi:hypothetical protein
MARKINSAITGPLTLGPSDDPLTITSAGTITSTGANVDGIDGAAGTAWTIVNKGTVASAGGWGINLMGAGALKNSGAILGGFQTGGAGTLTNQGTISGSGEGVVFGSGGTVTNDANGTIIGGTVAAAIGVHISGGSGTIRNNGSISGPGAGPSGIGVELDAGGVITNGASGSIFGLGSGVVISGGTGTIQNSGSISAAAQDAVLLMAGGAIANLAGGLIEGFSDYAVEISGGAGTVTNQGTIDGGPAAVFLAAGGTVSNRQNGLITANVVGISVGGGAGTVTNSGSINGFVGMQLFAGGIVSNGASGSISSAQTGIDIAGAPGTVTNDGKVVSGNSDGVRMEAGGTVTNGAQGTISSGGFSSGSGIEIVSGSGTVVNAGMVSGHRSVLFDSGTSNNLLVINPGAVFTGAADATAATNSTIELAKGTGAISGIGAGNFLGFNTLDVDARATWTLSGAGNTISTVLNDGKLEVSGGLTASAAVDPTSTGVFILDGGSTLEIAQALGADTRISFTTGSELVLDHAALFGENIGTGNYAGSLLRDFGGGSTIDIKDFGSAGLDMSYTKGTGLLQLSNAASQLATLDFQNSSIGAGTFHFSGDGGSGVLITHS